jgi:hypothetical protein
MSLSPGTRLGPYEVIAPLGAGGMGEVYRARDTKLGRDIALKILPETFARDSDRVARFEREARTLASLNHPAIAQIYGLEDGAIVMELVDGEDLSVRIARGPIPLDEALAIARPIVDALEAAHDAGIVHRDLKPANIKLRGDGSVKVLDFGLAKAGPVGGTAMGSALTSPTITSPAALTMGGVILGTAAYMAPEQAKGRPVDKRADIWAFGCVLYEMVTGRRPFEGEDVTDTIAAVVSKEPDWTRVPAPLLRLIQSCLQKDPKRRLRDIGDAWSLMTEERGSPAPTRSTSWVPWTIAAVFALVAAAFGMLVMRRVEPIAPLVQFQLPIVEEAGAMPGALMSPDGQRIAYSSGNHMWIRHLGTLAARPVPEGDPIVVQPFWSADSRYLFMSSDGALKRTDEGGGPAQTICKLPGVLSGGFTDGDRVVFATVPGGIFTAPLAGGTPVSLFPPMGAYSLRNGALLPDHDHFVFMFGHPAEDKRGIYVTSLSRHEPPKRLLPDVSAVAYMPRPLGSSGSLILMRGGSLIAQPFDPRRLELVGESRRVVESVGGFSTSANGSIVYRAASPGRRLTWMDRQGNTLGTVGAPDQYLEVALSHDGAAAAVVRYEALSPPSTWVFDLARESSRRLAVLAIKPVWSADGREIVVATRDASAGSTTIDLVRMPQDGHGAPQRIVGGKLFVAARDISTDGKWLMYVQADPKTTKEDLWVISLLPGEQKPEPYLVTDYSETDGMFSPDGRFVAYVSNETGTYELYVRSFPVSAGGKWRISSGGGYQPRWRRDGKELLFFTADGRMMSTDVTVSPAFRAGIPRTLFRAPVFGGGASVTNHYWDLSPDGQRFLINTTEVNDASAMLTVVMNWNGADDLATAGR